MYFPIQECIYFTTQECIYFLTPTKLHLQAPLNLLLLNELLRTSYNKPEVLKIMNKEFIIIIFLKSEPTKGLCIFLVIHLILYVHMVNPEKQIQVEKVSSYNMWRSLAQLQPDV